MEKFNLTIASPQNKIFQDEVYEVIVPAKEGWLTVLPGHAPLLATLKKGKIKVGRGDYKREIEIKEGFIEVTEKKVTMLVKKDSA